MNDQTPAPMPEWIAVEDRLPASWETVLIFSRVGARVIPAYKKHTSTCPMQWVNLHNNSHARLVTHWMELPPRPGAKQSPIHDTTWLLQQGAEELRLLQVENKELREKAKALEAASNPWTVHMAFRSHTDELQAIIKRQAETIVMLIEAGEQLDAEISFHSFESVNIKYYIAKKAKK